MNKWEKSLEKWEKSLEKWEKSLEKNLMGKRSSGRGSVLGDDTCEVWQNDSQLKGT